MKKLLLTAAFATTGIMLQAAPVTPAEALERALGESPARVAGTHCRYVLAETRRAGDIDAIYIYSRNDNKGFIVAPADDRAPALLGYGESEIVDESGKMSPEFLYWIDELGRQVAYAAEHPTAGRLRISRPEREPIAIQCATRWNQGSPYNSMCPPQDPPHAVTGCVATAMAQVMKYHNWPVTGEGEISYQWSRTTLSENFGEVTFDWENMLDEYTGDEPRKNRTAVARLMKCAGYSVEMNYSLNGSGAQSVAIAPALGRYFRYDKALSYQKRDYYSLAEWEEMIYSSLRQYGPVIYNGQSGAGGHSFVCDGYEGDGYFHFNWGWGGLSDGYFLLDALDPAHQGIGGANGGFDFMQDAILGIRPDREGDSQWSYSMYAQGICSFELNKDGYENASYISVNNGIYNFGPGDIEQGLIGLRYTDIDNPQLAPIDEIDNFGPIKVRYGFNSIRMFYTPELADGRYEVELVYSNSEGQIVPVPYPIYGTAKNVLTVSDGELTLSSVSIEAPDFTDAEIPTVIDPLVPVTVKGKLVNVNDTPYLCFLSAVVLDEGMESVLAYSMPRVYDLEGSETADVDMTANINKIRTLPEGYYNLGMANLIMETGEIALLNEPVRVYIGDPSGVDEIAAEDAGVHREYFTPQGAKVAEAQPGEPRPELGAGIYIVRTQSGAYKTAVR